MSFSSRIPLSWLVTLLLGFSLSSSVAQRVACVGDSITLGFGERPYTEYLNEDFLGAWDITNYGESGATVSRSGDFPYETSGSYSRSLRSAGADKVIIMMGTNDAKWHNWKGPEHFEAELRHFINIYANKFSLAELYLVTPIPVIGNGAYNISPGHLNDEVVPIVRKLAGFRGARLIDLHSQFLNGMDLYADNIHPTDPGANRIASIIGSAITGSTPTPTPIPDPGTQTEPKTKLEAASENLGGGWYRMGGFGDYYAKLSPWIFHPDLGWVWDATDDPDDMVLWSEGAGFVWTSQDVYPNYYSFDEEGWYLLFEDEEKGTYFSYNFDKERWERSPFGEWSL